MVDAPPESSSFAKPLRSPDLGGVASAGTPPSGGGPPPKKGGPLAKGRRASASRRGSRHEVIAAEAPARALIEQGHHREALAWLARTYTADLYGYCYRLAKKNDALAQDVLQDTFILASSGLSNLRAHSCLRTWLRVIAYRRLIDLVRFTNVRLGVTPEGDPDELPTSERGAEEWMDLKFASRELQDALAELSAEEQHGIALRFEDELSYEEMSLLTGEKPGTLQARVVRAQKVLRRRLEKRKVTL
jgi:RNA polymerase sigma factor (sigma-70 family)